MFRSEQNRRVSLALGIDIGTTNTKVVVLEIADDGACIERVIRSAATPSNGADLVAVVLRLTAEAADAAGAPIETIGVASMAETGTLLDEDGAPSGELLRWNATAHDAAAHDATGVDELVRALGSAELYRATGVPAVHKAPLGMWHTLRTHADRWSRHQRWAGVADLVALTLTGRFGTDHTLAARTMAYRLPDTSAELARGFDDALLDSVGVLPGQLPEVLIAGEVHGRLRPAIAARLGVPSGIPVILAGHDHAVGAWAAGVREPGEAANSVGTAEALVRVLGAGADRDRAWAAGMSLARTVDGEHESLLAGNPTAGALVDWVFERLLPDEARESVLAAVDRLPIGPGDTFVLPYPRGRQSPYPDRGARFAIVDTQGRETGRPSDPAELMRLTLEALALQLRWMDAAQTEVAGAERASTITSLGGPGAANAAWWQIKSAVMPAALDRVNLDEPVAAGAALLAAARAELCDPGIRLPRRSHEPATRVAYGPHFTAFTAAARAAHPAKAHEERNDN